MMLEWLRQNTPQDVDHVGPVNRQESQKDATPQVQEILSNRLDEMHLQPQPQPYGYQGFSPGSTSFRQTNNEAEQLSPFRRDPHGRLFVLDENSDSWAPVDEATQPQTPPPQPRYQAFHAYLSPAQRQVLEGQLASRASQVEDVQEVKEEYEPSPSYHATPPFQPTTHFQFSTPEQSFSPIALPQPQIYTTPTTSPERRVFSRPHSQSPRNYPYARAGPKLNFIHKPDPLGDTSQWTAQEIHDNRCIVGFTKSMRGDVITLDCFPVAPHEYRENMTTISCIYWHPNPPGEIQHKYSGKCVFTSVDIIMLIESFVDYAFAVQEKNRIRRNLEGFKPQTVKKEGDTMRFFTQVMGYSQPKCRNIEKDIKVFLWSDITKALRKIIHKYTKGGSVSLGRPTSEPIPTPPTMGLTTQAPLSESLPTQHTFRETPDEYAQYNYPYDLPPSAPTPFNMNHAEMYEGDDGSDDSISPEISPTTNLAVPTAEFNGNEAFNGTYVGVAGLNGHQIFGGYGQDVSADYI